MLSDSNIEECANGLRHLIDLIGVGIAGLEEYGIYWIESIFRDGILG
tara:strand:- start:145 stop:285 length:141 start_codon:yes stop_codon:yes gene_type:complete